MHKIAAVVGLTAIALVLSALPASAQQQVIKATVHDTYRPKIVHVNIGELVIWKNADTDDHVVRATSSNWNKAIRLSPGEKTTEVFENSGRYTYKCTLHANMHGVVKVR